MIGPGERPQEIYTPNELLQPLRELWGQIALDPCSGPNSTVAALQSYYVSKKILEIHPPKPDPEDESDSDPIRYKIHYTPAPGELNGLELPWLNKSYCNPPFGELEAWMWKAAYEGYRRKLEVAQLVPVRPHRKWWRAVRKTMNALVWLDPVFFIGYDSGFPAPLAMGYWGEHPKEFARLYEAAGVGECDSITER